MVKILVSQLGFQGDISDRERDLGINGMKNLLVGLCDSENYALALGILRALDLKERYLQILSPIAFEDGEKVRSVRLGKIRVRPDGQEERS